MSYDEPNKTREFSRQPPPLLDEVLIKILQRQRDMHRRRPDMFPADNLDASNYWRQIMEPPNEHSERPEWTHTEKAGYWKTPYIDRMADTLKKFLNMKQPEQAFIIDWIENKNTPWRGDDIDMYQLIIEETQKIRLNPAAYKDNASIVLKEFRIGK